MNLTRIYKAIDEGLKQSLIDFGNNKILKSSLVNNRLISEQDIDDWYESGEDMPEDMYEELCNNQYNGFYKVKDNDLLKDIYKRINFENINLNWLDISNLDHFAFDDKSYKFRLDISHWTTDKIPNKAFWNCSSLTFIQLPANITYIGEWTFSWCASLTSILIPDSVTTIDVGAFNKCVSLTSILIPDSIISIGALVFYNCEALASIKIPNSITFIGDRAFLNCVALTNILYNGTINLWNQIHFGNIVKHCTIHCLDGDIKIKCGI